MLTLSVWLSLFLLSKNDFTNTERIQEGKTLLIVKKKHFIGIVLLEL